VITTPSSLIVCTPFVHCTQIVTVYPGWIFLAALIANKLIAVSTVKYPLVSTVAQPLAITEQLDIGQPWAFKASSFLK